MARVIKKRRLANPGTPRKGSMAAKQKMARLRALRHSNGNPKRKTSSAKVVAVKAKRRVKKTRNVGELITIGLANPTERKGRKIMAGRKRAIRRRKNRGVTVMANPRRRRIFRAKRANPRYRRIVRRRNPDPQGLLYQVGGVIGGATLTGIIVGIIPPQYTQGPMGYLTTGIVAYAQGALAGKAFKNSTLGDSMIVGGMTVLVLKVLSEFLPGLAVGLAPRGLGWTYVNAPMTTKAMENRFLAYPMEGGGVPAVVPNGGMSGIRRGWGK